jgi:hypothetical protein
MPGQLPSASVAVQTDYQSRKRAAISKRKELVRLFDCQLSYSCFKDFCFLPDIWFDFQLKDEGDPWWVLAGVMSELMASEERGYMLHHGK